MHQLQYLSRLPLGLFMHCSITRYKIINRQSRKGHPVVLQATFRKDGCLTPVQKDTETSEVSIVENYTDVVSKKQMKALTTTMPLVVKKEKKKKSEREIVSRGNLCLLREFLKAQMKRISNLQILDRVQRERGEEASAQLVTARMCFTYFSCGGDSKKRKGK